MTFNPLDYQRKIMEDHWASNEAAQNALLGAIRLGHQVFITGSISGPYTNSVFYRTSSGLSVTMIEPASLHWIDLDILGGME